MLTVMEAQKVERGFKLLSDDHVLIRDEITFDGIPNTIRWGMMTDASIELLGDKAVLSKNGKKFFLQAFADQPITFEFEPAKAYHKDAKDNTGKSLLFIRLNEDLDQDAVNLSVVLGNNMNGLSDVIINTKLASW